MSRGLVHSLFIALLGSVVLQAAPPATVATPVPTILERFLSLDDAAPKRYRALRRLDARNGRHRAAWMDVWTEGDEVGGFRYSVVGEGGSAYIRTKIFRASLESEKKLYASDEIDRAAVTPENYLFGEADASGGLSALEVTPRRKDVLLVDGAIFLNPDDGDLVRIEGRLSKAPSFWIRHVDIVRSFRRVAGARVPVSLEAVANIRFAGKAVLRMSYDYAMVNGHIVGDPQPRTANDAAPRFESDAAPRFDPAEDED
jgi:hypothetical protein